MAVPGAWILLGVLAGVSGPIAAGQDALPSPPPIAIPAPSGYIVTGRVLCGDTQRPARFTQVNLLPVTQGNGSDDFGGRGRRLSAHTDLDGNFAVTNVPAGDYYVTGTLTGYRSQTNELQAALSAGGDPGAAATGVPLVHVSGGGASATLTLQRGGVIAGTVQWDDGSPAAGVQVSAQLAPATGVSSTPAPQTTPGSGFRSFNFGGGAGSAQTDDRGRYRLTGLAPGAYLVRAAVQAPVPIRGDERAFTRTFNLFVYAPNKVRRTDAVPITIASTEEHGDVSILMGLAGMHSISGSVSSTAATVSSGTVSLTDQTDASLSRTGFIGADGGFTVVDIPPGNYSLTVNASTQPPFGGAHGGPSSGNGSTPRFQPLQESITVADGDLTGLSLTVTPATTSP